MVVLCLFSLILFVLCSLLFPLLSPFLAMMSLVGYFLSCPLSYVCFPLFIFFFSDHVPDWTWFGFV